MSSWTVWRKAEWRGSEDAPLWLAVAEDVSKQEAEDKAGWIRDGSARAEVKVLPAGETP